MAGVEKSSLCMVLLPTHAPGVLVVRARMCLDDIPPPPLLPPLPPLTAYLFSIYLPSTVDDTPAPGVILIHGSGPNDRYEDIDTVRPFYDVGRYLARLGFVVLLYDKRTCSAPMHSICQNQFCSVTVREDCVLLPEVVVDDFALDARAALAYLRTRSEVDATRLVVVGHSQGCDLAPGVAAVEDGVSHVVLLMGR
jgi:dienelactone hydrolase